MISVRVASIIAIAAFATGSFFAPPVQQAIAAVIATDVQCTGCVGTSDLAGNGVTAAKIKDSEVKAAEIATGAVGASEIATDAVGAAELQGVTKLLFGECIFTAEEVEMTRTAGSSYQKFCNINGVDYDDSAMATLNNSNPCLEIQRAVIGIDIVYVQFKNDCPSDEALGNGAKIAVMVYDK
jgi:hypothetical protein